jgi:hypothetical protein
MLQLAFAVNGRRPEATGKLALMPLDEVRSDATRHREVG